MTELRLVRGELTDEELAALVLALRTRRRASPHSPPVSRWMHRTAQLRQPIHPGPDAWRTNQRP